MDDLGAISQKLLGTVAGPTKEYLRQGTEALKTGGIGAQIPLITRALDASRGQLSSDLNLTQENLAKSRLGGTPFGQQILSQARIAGGDNIARIPTDYAQGFIQQLPSFLAALTGQGVSGMNAAAGAQSGIVQSKNQAYAQILSAAIPKTSFNFNAGMGG